MKCVEVYKELYHQEPFDVAFCPYRISPLGAHIDHQYGKINGLAIDKGIHMAYHPKQNGVVELQSLNFPKRAQFFVNAVPEEKQGDWADHLRGAAKMLGEKYRLKVGLSGIIEGSLPIGGLSSSASVIICFLSALCKVNGIHEETYSGLTLDDERIRQAIIEFRPRLVVIDPIQAYLGSDSDLQIAGRARKLMQRLGMWASVYDCAIVLIGHLNKKEETKGLYRSLGSIDVVAAARSVLQVERDQKDTDIRIVRQIKNSLAPSDGEIRFSITAEMGFQWLECKSTFVSSEQPKVPEFESKTEKAA